MGIVFNPFTSNFDYTGNSSASSWKAPVANFAALPSSGNTSGDARIALNSGMAYEWNGTSWQILNGLTPTAVSATSAADGISIDSSNNVTLHVADGINPGLVSTTTQTIAGNKTFTGTVDIGSPTITGGPLNIQTLGDDINQGFNITSYDGSHTMSILQRANGDFFFYDNNGDTVFFFNSSKSATGVGPIDPQYKWDVTTQDNNTTVTAPDSGSVCDILNAGTTDGNFGTFGFSTPSTLYAGINGVCDNHTSLTAHFSFIAQNAGTMYEVAQLTNTGLGIGVGTPGQSIDVSGTGRLRGLSSAGVVANDATGLLSTVPLGAANGVASLDSSGKVPASQLPSNLFEFQGAWNPSTNTPALADGTGTNGYVYRVSTAYAGTVSGLTDPSMTNFQVGNLVIYSSSVGKWQQNTAADGVTSVNGAQGAVTVNAINQLTSDVTTSAASGSQSLVSTVAKIQGNTVSGTTGTGNVVFSASPTFTGTITSPGINVSGQTASTVPYLDSSKNLVSSAITPTQLSYVDATSSIQTQLNSKPNTSVGDINETSFSASNNISSATNITGFAFSSSVGSFEALVQVLVTASTNLRQTFNIQGTKNGAGNWVMSQTTSGDESGFVFTVTSAGQLQYTNLNYSGFSSAVVKFRAISLSA